MMKHLFSILSLSMVALSATVALADSTQTHHCKMADGSVDLKKTHKECDAAKGKWAADATAPTPPAKDTTKPGAPTTAPAAPSKDVGKPSAPATPVTPSKGVAKPAAPAAPSPPARDAAKPMEPVGNNTQDHHCRMPDKTVDMRKTHTECEAAKGQWAKDNEADTTAPATENTTQDHHCRMPDKTMDMKKTHKECQAAKGEWAKDAGAKTRP